MFGRKPSRNSTGETVRVDQELVSPSLERRTRRRTRRSQSTAMTAANARLESDAAATRGRRSEPRRKKGGIAGCGTIPTVPHVPPSRAWRPDARRAAALSTIVATPPPPQEDEDEVFVVTEEDTAVDVDSGHGQERSENRATASPPPPANDLASKLDVVANFPVLYDAVFALSEWTTKAAKPEEVSVEYIPWSFHAIVVQSSGVILLGLASML